MKENVEQPYLLAALLRITHIVEMHEHFMYLLQTFQLFLTSLLIVVSGERADRDTHYSSELSFLLADRLPKIFSLKIPCTKIWYRTLTRLI